MLLLTLKQHPALEIKSVWKFEILCSPHTFSIYIGKHKKNWGFIIWGDHVHDSTIYVVMPRPRDFACVLSWKNIYIWMQLLLKFLPEAPWNILIQSFLWLRFNHAMLNTNLFTGAHFTPQCFQFTSSPFLCFLLLCAKEIIFCSFFLLDTMACNIVTEGVSCISLYNL